MSIDMYTVPPPVLSRQTRSGWLTVAPVALCLLAGFTVLTIWVNYTHNLDLTLRAIDRSGVTYEGRYGFGLMVAVFLTAILLPATVALAGVAYPIRRGSRAAVIVGAVGAALAACTAGLVAVVLLWMRPFGSVDGDGDPPDALVRSYDELVGQDPAHWYQLALPLSAPAVVGLAVVTAVVLGVGARAGTYRAVSGRS